MHVLVTGAPETGQYGMVVPRFVQRAVANEPITVFGDGEQSRSFWNNLYQRLDTVCSLCRHI